MQPYQNEEAGEREHKEPQLAGNRSNMYILKTEVV
jgi:hypothetical protein